MEAFPIPGYFLKNCRWMRLSLVSSNMFLRRGLIANSVALTADTSALLPSTFQERRQRPTGPRCSTAEQIDALKMIVENDTKAKMDKIIESVLSHFYSVRTGMANPAMLDRLQVEYRGSPIKVRSIADITAPDSSSLQIQPHDKSCLKDIEKAVALSDLHLTPNNDGKVIRIHIPQLTSDRRKDLLRVVHKQAEEGKIAIRSIRREALKLYQKLGKEKKLSDDNVRDLSIDVQKIADEYVQKIDAVLQEKDKDIMTL